ncbi:MAG: transcription-repair coupling factor, partial [Clostridia bacterium]|nr:transcription-repair coupling factor [Clostridia bacterium]
GALLGEKQHGQMNVVGYDMYMRILKEAVEEEQGVTEQPQSDCAIDITVSAFIPKDYVPSEKTRIDLYKKIAALNNQEEYEDMVDELCDRFSDPPESILNLMKIALLRALARENGIMDIKQKQDSVLFFVTEPQPELLAKLVHAMKGRVLYSIGAKPYFTLRIQNRDTLLEEINHFLNTYAELKKSE